MLLALSILIYALIILIELPGLLKNRLYREVKVFVVLFLAGVFLSLAQFYHWPLPNPLQDLYPMLEFGGD